MAGCIFSSAPSCSKFQTAQPALRKIYSPICCGVAFTLSSKAECSSTSARLKTTPVRKRFARICTRRRFPRPPGNSRLAVRYSTRCSRALPAKLQPDAEIRRRSNQGNCRRKIQRMIITRTPMRISFFGGGTDYPVYFREFGGAVLSTAIDKSCYITCRHLPPFFAYHSRVSYSRIENVDHNSEFQHPSVRACLAYLGVEQGVEIHHVADLPARTGLGTSSAFTVGLLLGLYALKNQMRDKRTLATDAIYVEQELNKESVGAQDQVSASFGGFNRITFQVDDAIEVNRVVTTQHRLVELEQHLALYFTGFSRIASEIAKEQIRVTPQKRRELETMFQMVSEAEAIVTSPSRSINEFGQLLHESWKVKRTLTQNITNNSIDQI